MDHLFPIIFWSSAVLLLLLLIFFPRRGMLARFKEYRQARQREQLEDILKYLFGGQQSGHTLSAAELAASLQQPVARTVDLLKRMETQQLIENQEGNYRLTHSGEKSALHVVRAHRLWERYLADEALMPLENVHSMAHRREHGMTVAQVNALDAALGHPLQDPHGDPIPNASGNFRPHDQGSPLPQWQEGKIVKIVHLEDEPPLAFAQILAAGLQVGQVMRVMESNATRLVLTDGQDEFTLAPQVAANVFVSERSETAIVDEDVIPLGELADNQKAEIVRLDDQCMGFTRRRFLDLGFTPGTEIFPELQNSFGDPRAYRLRGTLIALRKEQAAQILVRPQLYQ